MNCFVTREAGDVDTGHVPCAVELVCIMASGAGSGSRGAEPIARDWTMENRSVFEPGGVSRGTLLIRTLDVSWA